LFATAQNASTNRTIDGITPSGNGPSLSTLYIRLPARASDASAQHAVPTLGCAFALASDRGDVEREGVAALPELANLVAAAQRVTLILAAADVSLLRVAVPPLSPARLKVALPNLVEDQLIGDLAESVVVAGRSADGLRTVAVVQRDWLEMLVRVVAALGARRISALPAQLCLPYRAGAVSAAITEIDTGTDRDVALALRLSQQDGIGLPVLPPPGGAVAPEALQTLRLVVPEADITLYVPPAEVGVYQQLADERTTIQPDHWAYWIAGAQDAEPDLLGGLTSAAGPGFDWSRWRWPLTLAIALLLVNIVALNVDWWRLKQEADTARAALTQTFQAAYPNETVIVDPVLQMRQKIAAAKQAAGQPAPDDFAALVAGFAEAWNHAGSTKPLPPIDALEYHERALLVRSKALSQIPRAQLETALAARNLTSSQQGADGLQIRSVR
jgi:general secretion pathway protein L